MNTVAVVMHYIGHYHHARLQSAAAAGLDVVAIQAVSEPPFAGFAPPLELCRYKSVSLFRSEREYRAAVPRLSVGRVLVAALNDINPSAIAVSGWAKPESIAGIRWARKQSKGLVIMSESQQQDASRSVFREFVKRRIVKLGGAALVGGDRHRDYLTKLGMKPDVCELGYDIVDNDHFMRPGGLDASACKGAGYESSGFILASARFVPKKNISGLIRAYAAYTKLVSDPLKLVILGDGPERESLVSEVDNFGISDLVKMPGFVSYNEIPNYYANAAFFIHLSLVEQWGLVVNEAVSAGLPVIVSRQCGCADELVINGVNGLHVDGNDLPSITLAIKSLASNSELRSRMGVESERVADLWRPERFGQGLSRAVEKALKAPREPLRPFDKMILAGLEYTVPTKVP